MTWSLEGSVTAPCARPKPGGSGAVGAPSAGAPVQGWEGTAASAALVVAHFDNGTALVEYTPRVAGEVLLSVLLRSPADGEAAHISGSPFQVLVADGPLDGEASEAYGEGLYVAVAGREATFTVAARDAWGNLRSDDGRDSGATYSDGRLDYQRRPGTGPDPGAADAFNVTLELLSPLSAVNSPGFRGVTYRPAGTSVAGSSEYLGNGLHRIRYNATARGTYNLTVRALSTSGSLGSADGHSGDGSEIVGSPFTPYVAPTDPSGAYSTIWGHGLKDQVRTCSTHRIGMGRGSPPARRHPRSRSRKS